MAGVWMRTSAVPMSRTSRDVMSLVVVPLPHVPDVTVGSAGGSLGRCAADDATAHEPTWKSYGNVADIDADVDSRHDEHCNKYPHSCADRALAGIAATVHESDGTSNVGKGAGQAEGRSRAATTASWNVANPCTSLTGARSVDTSDVLEIVLSVRKDSSVSIARPNTTSPIDTEMTPPSTVRLRMRALPTGVKWFREKVSTDLMAERAWRKKKDARDDAADVTTAATMKPIRIDEEDSEDDWDPASLKEDAASSPREMKGAAGVHVVGIGADSVPGHRVPPEHGKHPSVVSFDSGRP
jgi:hypothetical protein